MISAAWPLLVSVMAMSVPDPRMAGVVAVLVLSMAQSAACIALLRDAVTARLGGPPPDRRVVVVAVALTAVGTLAAAWAFPVVGCVAGAAAGAGPAAAVDHRHPRLCAAILALSVRSFPRDAAALLLLPVRAGR